MENTTSVSGKAFRYRFVVKECVGILVMLLLSLLVGGVLFFFKIPSASLSLAAFAVVLFLLQLGVAYVAARLEYKNLVYRIDANSISLRSGFLSSDTETIPFEKIKNSSFDQSFFQRLFSVGDIVIDQDDEKFYWMSIDTQSANTILDAVSAKSNIQPISVASNAGILTNPASTAVNQTGA